MNEHTKDSHQFLISRGWLLARSTGRHPVYKYPPTGAQIAIPMTVRDRGCRWENFVAQVRQKESRPIKTHTEREPAPMLSPTTTPTIPTKPTLNGDVLVPSTLPNPAGSLHKWLHAVRNKVKLSRDAFRFRVVSLTTSRNDLPFDTFTWKQVIEWESRQSSPTIDQFRMWCLVMGVPFTAFEFPPEWFVSEKKEPAADVVEAPTPEKEEPQATVENVVDSTPTQEEVVVVQEEAPAPPVTTDPKIRPIYTAARIAAKLSPTNAAAKLGIALHTYFKIEEGSYVFNLDELVRWARVMKVVDDSLAVWVIPDVSAGVRGARRRCRSHAEQMTLGQAKELLESWQKTQEEAPAPKPLTRELVADEPTTTESPSGVSEERLNAVDVLIRMLQSPRISDEAALGIIREAQHKALDVIL